MMMLVVACTPGGDGSDSPPLDQPGSIEEEITMYVGPEMVDCVGVAPRAAYKLSSRRRGMGITLFRH